MINNIDILSAFEQELTKVAYMQGQQPMQQPMQRPMPMQPMRPQMSQADKAMDDLKANAIRGTADVVRSAARDLGKKRRGRLIDRMRDRKDRLKGYFRGGDKRPEGFGENLRQFGSSLTDAAGKKATNILR